MRFTIQDETLKAELNEFWRETRKCMCFLGYAILAIFALVLLGMIALQWIEMILTF
jgi:hypothetical protein